MQLHLNSPSGEGCSCGVAFVGDEHGAVLSFTDEVGGAISSAVTSYVT